MSDHTRAFARLASDAQRVFGDRFVSLVAYGANASVVFASSLLPGDLDALSVLVETWERDGLATPLVMTPAEFHRSLDAFPLEYQAMLDRHTVIAGHPPFDEVAIRREDLRRACEVQARSHLIHLRQGWLQHGAHHGELTELVVRSAGPFRALLANVALLHGHAHASSNDLAAFAAQTIGMAEGVVRAVLDLDDHPDRGSPLPDLAAYLAAAEHLWNFVDTWRDA